MSEILKLAEQFQKNSQQHTKHTAEIVHNELTQLESFTKKRIEQSRTTIATAMSDHDNQTQQALNKVQLKLVTVFITGLISGLAIAILTLYAASKLGAF